MESNQLMLLPEDSHAKTYLQQDSVLGYMEQGLGYGENSLELCATYDPNTCSLKMLQGCLLEKVGDGSTDYSATWPRAGIFWNGNVFRHPVSAHRTTEIERMVLPTPVKADGEAYTLKQVLRAKETWETISGLTGLVVARVLGLSGRQKSPDYYLVNPLLLERMMGFPPGWTEIADSETP